MAQVTQLQRPTTWVGHSVNDKHVPHLEMEKELAHKFTRELSQCRGIVAKICRIYGADADDRNDLQQDILLNAWSSYPRFRGEAKFSTWLYRVALNTAIGRTRRKQVPTDPLPLRDVMPDLESDKIAQLELLNQLMKRLTDQEKALVALYLDELSYQEMAEITGLTENNVGVKLNRIKIKLKNSHYEH
jgi:RNA polymerase sigma factor (sigma-70 family)